VRAFAEFLARFLCRLHDAGIFHEDFHAGNVLVGGEPAAPVFHLVDIADINLGAPLSYGDRVTNLAVLNRFFSLVVPGHWRLRFLEMYFACGAIDPDHPGRDRATTSRRIEDATRRGLLKLWAKRDARVYGNNKYYRHVHAGALAGRAKRTAEADAALKLFEYGDPFTRAEMILKDSASSCVGVFRLDTPAGPHRIVIKKRKSQNRWKALLDPFRASRAVKGFFYGAAFEHRYLPTPAVLAALDCRRLGCIEASYLVTDYVEGAESLARCLAAGQSSPLFQRINADRSAFLSSLAHTLRRMHAYGFSMRDLKAANILVYPAGRGVAVSIADLDDVRLYAACVPEPRAMRNIARLYYDAVHLGAITRRESMWFLECYLGTSERGALSRWVSGIARNLVYIRGLFAKKGTVG
jgi:tRNA A-37 threonylcarbamoyl transferase component Bud32